MAKVNIESDCGHTEQFTTDDVPNDLDISVEEWAEQHCKFHNWTCDDDCAIAVPAY